MKRRGNFSTFVAVVIVGVLLLFLIAFQVRINECAIVFTFGRAERVIHEPGLYWKLPYPLQTVTRYDTRIRVLHGKYSECYTHDKHTIIVTLAMGWRIAEPQTFYESVGTVRDARDKLTGFVEGAAKDRINTHDLAHFISTTDAFDFDAVESEIVEAVREEALAKYGAEIAYVEISHLSFPEDVTKQVIERIKAERKGKADGLRAQGTKEAKTIRSKADRDSKNILSDARAVALDTRAKGDAVAAEHYARLAEHPELARFLRELEAIRKLKKGLTILLTTDSAVYRLLSPTFTVPGSAQPKGAPPPGKAPDATKETRPDGKKPGATAPAPPGPRGEK